jgi:hypothetical protein
MPDVLMQPFVRNVRGQPSFLLSTSTVELAISELGGMLAPVTFGRDGDRPIQPYAIAPWWAEPPIGPPILQALRGDFICSAFGDNDEPWRGRMIPPHGDTANHIWRLVHRLSMAEGGALRLALELPTQGGRCIATTVLLEGHQFIYQRHEFAGLDGVFNPGHHAMLGCPPVAGSAQLSFGPHVLVGTGPGRASSTRLRSGCSATDATHLIGVDGDRVDATRFPHAAALDDAFMVCADPAIEHAWSAVTFAGDGYAWLSLRNSAQLPSTFVWLSNGGRAEPPWNSRHCGVIALEDMMGYYCAGLTASERSNELNARGIATCMSATPAASVRIPYIQGAIRIPERFDVVSAVTPVSAGELLVTSRSGCEIRVPCRWEFLLDARIPRLCAD